DSTWRAALLFRRGASRHASFADLYCAFGMVFPGCCYDQILGPRRHLPKFSNSLCRHAGAYISLNPHLGWQAAESYVERSDVFALIPGHRVLADCPVAAIPSSVMKSRLFTRSPRPRGRAVSGDVEAESARSRQIYCKYELGRLHHRQVSGFFAFDDSAGIDTGLSKRLRQACSVAHQSAGFGVVIRIINGRQHVTRGQRGDLDAPVEEHRIGADHQGVNTIIHQSSKRHLNLATVASLDHLEVYPDCRGGHNDLCLTGLEVGVMRVHHQTNPLRVWHKLTQEPQLLWPKITKQEAHARGIATRARERHGKPKLDRVIRDHEDNWNCGGRGSCGECRRRIQRGDHGNLSVRELGSQPGQALVLIIAVAIVDHHVAAFDVALLGQTLSKNPNERVKQPDRGQTSHAWK